MFGQWPEATRLLPAAADPSSLFFVEMLTSVPVSIPPSRAVTLLGDAAHAMTPTLGRGANLALRGPVPLARALAERVRQSAVTGARLMGQNPLPAVL